MTSSWLIYCNIISHINICVGCVGTGVVYSAEYMKQGLFLYDDLLTIVLSSIRTTVNLLCHTKYGENITQYQHRKFNISKCLHEIPLTAYS